MSAKASTALLDAGRPHVVIIGGGFGGLAAAKALRNAPVRITLIDRRNHHLFQPLLYQVATAELSPGHIAAPIRGLLQEQNNVTVVLGEVTDINAEAKSISVTQTCGEQRAMDYDHLVVATGAQHSYFGRDDFAQHAPGMKTLSDALSIRHKVLHAFEKAEISDDPTADGLLTFVLVGAGPTGVEMAGALASLTRKTMRSSFRRINPASAKIILIDQANRILGAFGEGLSLKAQKHLEGLGVEVRLGHGIDGVVAGGERIPSKTVIWTAGVAASPIGKWLKVETDRAGRVRIQKDLTVAGRRNIFVVGDTASLDQDGRPLPGVVQVAMQQGDYAGKLIARRVSGQADLRPFRYFDKGNMAVVADSFAVLQSGRVQLSGWLAWLSWAVIHLLYLPLSNLRMAVFLQWLWALVSGTRGSQLIAQKPAEYKHQPSAEPLKL
jgi:NADH dehydrogenase